MRKTSLFSKVWLVLVAAFLATPIVATFIYSISTSWTEILPKSFTLDNYIMIFTDGGLPQALMRSVLISIIPIFLTGTMVMLALYTAIVYKPSLEKYIQFLCMVPYTVQGIILATSILVQYSGTSTIFSNRMVMLTMAYCIVILPFTYQGIRNSMYSINIRQLIEAAEILGASKLGAFVRVVMPNMIRGVMVSSLLSMAFILGDFALIRVLAGGHYLTAQMLLFNSRVMTGQRSSAIVIVMFTLTLTLTAIILSLQSRQKLDGAPSDKE